MNATFAEPARRAPVHSRRKAAAPSSSLRRMIPPVSVFVKLPAAAHRAAEEAAQAVAPERIGIEVAVLDDALRRAPTGGEEWLFVSRLDEAALAQIAGSRNALGAPRWAVVVLGQTSVAGVEALPEADWNSRAVGRALRSARNALRQAQQIAQLSGDLRTLARRVSHDLRTPVSCIYTTSAVLQEMPHTDPAYPGEMVDVIQESAFEISQLIDRVSFMLKASLDPLPAERVDLGMTVAAALHALHEDFLKAGIVVKQPAEWPKVSGVAKWLEVVWWNLLHNAWRHAGPTPQIELGWRVEGADLVCWAEDRGPGVSDKVKDRIFQPFELLHSVPMGQGIGLSLVHRLIALQGGRCGFENLAGGRGTRMWFALPAA